MKTDRNVSITQGSLYARQSILQLKELFSVFPLGHTMYFSYTFTWLLRSKETVLIKSLLLCENSYKFLHNCKFLSNCKGI